MKYALVDEITQYLPPNVITAKPLEFDWDEATNAVLFTAEYKKRFSILKSPFNALVDKLTEHYRSLVENKYQLEVDPDHEQGCMTFRFSDDPEANPNKGFQISADISIAWLKAKGTIDDPLDALNSWIGSSLLKKMAQDDKPQLIGMIRIRPKINNQSGDDNSE